MSKYYVRSIPAAQRVFKSEGSVHTACFQFAYKTLINDGISINFELQDVKLLGLCQKMIEYVLHSKDGGTVLFQEWRSRKQESDNW